MKEKIIPIRIVKGNTIASILLVVVGICVALSIFENRRQANDLRERLAVLKTQSDGLAQELNRMQSIAGAQNTNVPTKSMESSINDATARADEIRAWTITPTIPGIAIKHIDGVDVKIATFPIKRGQDPMKLSGYKVSAGWKPSANVEANLPYPWSPTFVEKFHQPFNADSFLFNMSALANFYRQTHDYEAIRPYVDYLVGRLKEYTITDGDASLVTYRFDYPFHDIQMKSGWLSSYGNASVIAGLTYMSSIAHRPELDSLATKYVNGLHRYDGKNKNWVTTVDDTEYLWFEEYPLDGKQKAHVLNGHIWTVFSLYYYSERHPESLDMLNAGLTSLKRYLPTYRYPGKINRYDRYNDYTPDYFPKNTVDEERSLFSITGDTFFNDMADAFMTDMPYNHSS